MWTLVLLVIALSFISMGFGEIYNVYRIERERSLPVDGTQVVDQRGRLSLIVGHAGWVLIIICGEYSMRICTMRMSFRLKSISYPLQQVALRCVKTIRTWDVIEINAFLGRRLIALICFWSWSKKTILQPKYFNVKLLVHKSGPWCLIIAAVARKTCLGGGGG